MLSALRNKAAVPLVKNAFKRGGILANQLRPAACAMSTWSVKGIDYRLLDKSFDPDVIFQFNKEHGTKLRSSRFFSASTRLCFRIDAPQLYPRRPGEGASGQDQDRRDLGVKSPLLQMLKTVSCPVCFLSTILAFYRRSLLLLPGVGWLRR